MRSRAGVISQQGGAALPPPADPILVLGSSNGTNTGGGTTTTITLPTYAAGDYMLLIIGNNQSSASWTGDGSASVTEVQEVGASRRLSFLKVNPVGSPGSFVITRTVSAVWSWVCLNLGQITPTIYTAENDLGSNTTSAIEMPTVTGVPSTDGHELQIIAASTNSTAVWTPPATPTGQTTRVSITTAPGLFVATAPCAAGLTSLATATVDRGNNGTARNEQALVAVFA